MRQARADALANRRRVLADPAREHQRVEPGERRRIGADLLADRVAELVDRQLRVGRAGVEQRAHVAARPRDAEQTRLA